jgi:acyl-CoA synthetase (AMP-forming)/AMP-acid ligase II
VARRVAPGGQYAGRPGLAFSDRVATLAWNGYRHLELYFGVSGSGRVLHTINPRLHPDQIAWIANHAEDQVLCFDMTFLPIVQAMHAQVHHGAQWVALCDADKLPADTGIPGLLSYEAWIGASSPLTTYAWPSSTRTRVQHVLHQRHHGQPQGRAVQPPLHHAACLCGALPDVMCLSARDAMLPVVPMFHVNAWGIPYSAR